MNTKGNFISLISVIFILLAGMAMTGCGTALTQAAKEGDIAALQKLLDEGANINENAIVGGSMNGSLLSQAAYYCRIETIKYLIHKGADINNATGWTDYGASGGGLRPLHMAARSGCTEAIKLLLDAGSDIDVRANKIFGSALAIAAYHGNIKSVKYLIERGADADDASQVLKGLADDKMKRTGGKEGLALLQKFEKQKIAVRLSENTPPSSVAKSDVDELPSIKAKPNKNAYAIVIGIDYRGRQDIPNLQYPSQDAKKVYDILTDPKYGGVPKENSILLLNEKATRNEMISALRKIKNWDGYVYVYYSGHGAPKTKGDKFVDAFLIPNDVVITDPEAMEDTAIKVSYLEELVDASQAKGVMVAIDACFTGGGKSIVPKGGKPLVLMGVSPELIKPKTMGKVVITSSAANQQSWEDEAEIKGGIFSYFLLEGLKGKAGKDVWVKVDELSNYIKENVPRTARKLKGVEQNPQVSGKGDFAVTRNWERAKVMDVEMALAKLKNAFEKGRITAEQLNKALDELKSQARSKTLEAFLEGKIDEKKFGELY